MVLNGALTRFFRQFQRRHDFSVINSPNDQWMVGTPFEKAHNYLLPDVRHKHPAPTLSSPRLGDSDPAGGAVISFGVAVPVKMNFDAGIFVGVNGLTGGADHLGRLHS